MADLACGIVGLPNVGKSTLFNALTSKQAEASNYPFCTIDPNVGIVIKKDPRLDVLAEMSKSKKIVPAHVKFVDIAGLVAGASKGEGLGNKFLSNIRETSAIVHVVRCFESEDVIHVAGTIDPLKDIEVINLELILSDLQMVENILSRLEKQAKGNKEILPEIELMKKILSHLNENKPLRTLELSDAERDILKIKNYPFLTLKKVIYAANVSDTDLPEMDNIHVRNVKAYAEAEGNTMIPICAKLEEEIAQLPPEERPAFLEALGLKESGLDRLIRTSFEMLGLMTFLTTGEIETRAWTIPNHTTAVEAAGEIHTDIQKGFIRAEVVSYEDMAANHGKQGAKEKGLVRYEGKDYLVKDGDVIVFMHNS